MRPAQTEDAEGGPWGPGRCRLWGHDRAQHAASHHSPGLAVRTGHVLRWLWQNKCHMMGPCATRLWAAAELIHSESPGAGWGCPGNSQPHPVSGDPLGNGKHHTTWPLWGTSLNLEMAQTSHHSQNFCHRPAADSGASTPHTASASISSESEGGSLDHLCRTPQLTGTPAGYRVRNARPSSIPEPQLSHWTKGSRVAGRTGLPASPRLGGRGSGRLGYPPGGRRRSIGVLLELMMMSGSVMGSLQQTWDVLTAP